MQPNDNRDFITSTPNRKRPSASEFNGLNGLIRAARVVENPSMMATSSPQPSSATVSASPSSSTTAAPTTTTWPDMPVGRGLGPIGGFDQQQYIHMQYARQFPPAPTTRSQWGLYRVLEHANLLEYFETFIRYGGDDVQQLVDADEEEFLEIMSLVGMTSKPLHVRRLQKSLHHWQFERRLMQLNGTFNMPNRYIQHRSPVKYVLPFTAAHTVATETYAAAADADYQDQQASSQESSLSDHYLAPREVLIGAPKRLRLMDNLPQRQQEQSQSESDSMADSEQHSFRRPITQKTTSASYNLREDDDDDEDDDGDDESCSEDSEVDVEEAEGEESASESDSRHFKASKF